MSSTPTLDSLRTQWVDAFNAHDLDAHVQLYTEDAILFGSGDALHRGHAGVRGYFGGLPADACVRNFPTPVIIHPSPDTAVLAGYVDFADGDALLPYRLTWALVQQSGHWKIAQHHGSPRKGRSA